MADEPGTTQAGEALRQEVGKIMADPAWGRDPALEAKVDALYKGRFGSGTVTIDEGLSVGGEAPGAGETADDADAKARNELILAPLRQEWGGEFDMNIAAAQVEARQLFSGEDGSLQAEHFADLGSRIRMHYGTKGETLALKFLADLGRIRKGEHR